MLNLTPRNNQPDPEQPSIDPVPVVDGSAYGFDTLGAVLRERREAMGVSLAEVEVATRIRQKYLSAIEADDWHLLPGEIVGRGFLRNYATYLGLDSNELVERRRAAIDPSLAASLISTSAGAPLPPERQVDYRPKDVDLRDESDGIENRERNITPALTVLLVLALAFVGWWSISRFGNTTSNFVGSVQTRVAIVLEPRATTAPIDVSESASSVDDGTTPPTIATAAPTSPEDIAPSTDAVALPPPPTDTPTPAPPPPTDTPTPEPPPPTDTPVPPPPTDTPVPLPPTDTPVPPPPTNTPAPVAPAVAAPSCPDPRAVITSPGVNQVVGGVIDIIGTATHENFQNYKLEFAPGGVDAGNNDAGWNWFAGSNAGPVQGGRLAQLDTGALTNGVWTIRVVTVDLTANFPPPCSVTITVQN